jgi:predicted amidohydrolase
MTDQGENSTCPRVLLAAICCQKGDWPGNLATHEQALKQAREEGCHLAVFPEMSLSGYVDPAAHPEQLLSLSSRAVQSMAELTRKYHVAAVFGISERGDDGAAYITQVCADHGRLAGTYRKRHLGEGEEAYSKGTSRAIFQTGRLRFGIAICAESGVDYPFDEPAGQGAQVIFLCAAPGLYGRRTDQESWRRGYQWWESAGLADARRHAKRTGAWIGLVTQAGATVDEDFPGLAALVAPSGEVVARLPDWRPGTLTVDLPIQP